MSLDELKRVLEAGLLAAGDTLSLGRLLKLFPEDARPAADELRVALAALANDYAERAIELAEIGGGYRIQVRRQYAPWVSRLWEERPGQYSRALLETLALIAYRQPITRGEISEVRGVSVSSSIVKTLQERGWVKPVGHREVPGRPALYGTTAEFLNYFNLRSLAELPALSEARELLSIGQELVAGGVIDTLPDELRTDTADTAEVRYVFSEESEKSEEVNEIDELNKSIESSAFSDGSEKSDDIDDNPMIGKEINRNRPRESDD